MATRGTVWFECNTFLYYSESQTSELETKSRVVLQYSCYSTYIEGCSKIKVSFDKQNMNTTISDHWWHLLTIASVYNEKDYIWRLVCNYNWNRPKNLIYICEGWWLYWRKYDGSFWVSAMSMRTGNLQKLLWKTILFASSSSGWVPPWSVRWFGCIRSLG